MALKATTRDALLVTIFALAALALWRTPVVLPLKLLTVFFHEASHALALWFTGGKVLEFDVNWRQAGHVLGVGGSPFVTLMAGYLGSLFWGVLIFLLAGWTVRDRRLLGALGISILLITAIWVRTPFALSFGLGTGALAVVAANKISDGLADHILHFVALVMMLYVPADIVSDTLLSGGQPSDATFLAEQVGGAPWMWGTLWLALSVITILCALWLRGRMPKRRHRRTSR